ncbi:TPR repeat-containing protein YfgC precursor [Thalassovita gelatinovora]|uniref:TPR repeat-containing protein YfgC n=1 Tax=Thalassovita gelatinovora TaxID=53501 RepID=A0A0P1FYT9_THAGE|nr:M48 family metalloprotease [Thalassovita gelatinovora]CUH66671.1 TPR repeat-containing protein YfgC precursor [Thalassovita gelatinovora]SEQ40282.1 Putative Zn-dependent protease, contains TPR repeats [Thalassovita gelatinovora]
MHPLLRILAVWAVLLAHTLPAQAITLLRDPDIEHALGEIARPMLNAAGLPAGSVKVMVIKDSSLNAFVIDHRHIFIHSGLLLKLKSADELQAVLAHEAAHIANGHIARRFANMRMANTITGLGMALAATAAASGADARAAGALSLGVGSSANRMFMSHTRAEESAADSSALRYLASAGADPKAMLGVLDIFRGQEMLNVSRQDPYARTHPLSRDRIRAVTALAQAAKTKPSSTANSAYWFARAQGKLSAFLRAPSWTLRRAGSSASTDIALIRQAVAYHRQPDSAKAQTAIRKLIALRPNDPFAHDLHGQILLESRNAKAAVAAYGRAAALAPTNALILGGQGRALLAAGNPKQARNVLEKARARDFSDARVLRDLATAYAKTGNTGMASVLTAERYALAGRFKDARIHAERAAGLLPRGSAPWLRAQDVFSAAEAQASKRKK